MNARQKAKKLKKELEKYKKSAPKVRVSTVPIEHYRAQHMISNRVLYDNYPVMSEAYIRNILANQIMDILRDKLIINQQEVEELDAQRFTADIWIAVYGDNR